MMNLRYPFSFVLTSLILIGFAATPAPAQQKGAKKEVVAVVNGREIPFRYYRTSLESHMLQNGLSREEDVDQATADDLFLQLINNELIYQEAEKLKVAVSEKEAKELLVADPPDFMVDIFRDDKGKFRKDLFRRVVEQPSRIADLLAVDAPRDQVVAEWKEDLETVVQYIRQKETRTRLIDTLYNQNPLSAAEIKERYFAEKTYLTGSFVRVLHSTIPDSLVPVSEEEARRWYREHREEYRIPPARSVSTLFLPVVPSPSDSAAARQRMQEIRSVVESRPVTERSQVIDSLLGHLPPNRVPTERAVPLSRMPAETVPQLVDAESGELVGPFPSPEGFVMLYVDDVLPARDTLIRARHLIVREVGDKRSDDSIRTFLEELKGLITSEAKFREAARNFGQDQAASRDGDLGYIGRGTMVREFDSALFSGRPGEVIGPVRTNYGYHLIWITDIASRSVHMRELRFPLAPSDEALAEAREDGELYAQALRTGMPIAPMLAEYESKYPGMFRDTSLLKQMDPYGDVLITTEFAFASEPGDIAVLDLPENRIAVLEVLQMWPDTIPPYEDIARYPRSHARRVRQMEMLKPKVEELGRKLTPEMLLGPMREIAPMAEVFLLKSQPIPTAPDESETLLDSLVMITPANSVSGPVRGKHGYYFLRVTERLGPKERDYERDGEEFRREYLERYRTELLEEKVTKARQFARITDLRPDMQALLAEGKKK